jgi:hypothetical protein
MKDIVKKGMRVHVYSPDKKEDRGFGTIEKVEHLRVDETGLTIAFSYPSRIVLDSGEATEGLYCWWISVESEEEILKSKGIAKR